MIFIGVYSEEKGTECLTKENRLENERSLAYHFPKAYSLLQSEGLLRDVVSYIMSAQQVAWDQAREES